MVEVMVVVEVRVSGGRVVVQVMVVVEVISGHG